MSFAATFKALSDPVRREILQLLKNGKMSAGEIGSHFDMTGATISYHLSVLKKADLVWETKVKNYVYYELNTSVVKSCCGCQSSPVKKMKKRRVRSNAAFAAENFRPERL